MIQILTDNLFGLTPPTREVGFFGSLQGSICQENHMFFVAPFQINSRIFSCLDGLDW